VAFGKLRTPVRLCHQAAYGGFMTVTCGLTANCQETGISPEHNAR